MPKRIDITQVVKLDDSNYERWKLQITVVLKAAEVWDVVSGETPRPPATEAAQRAAWDKKDIEAQAILIPTLDKLQTVHIYELTTAKSIFDRLKEVNADSSTLNKQHTLASFLNFKVDLDQPPVKAYLEMEQLYRSLKEMGVQIDEDTVITKIVSALPDERFQAFKKA